eukprot:Colp12_sorted_trinity150504_noHs@26911
MRKHIREVHLKNADDIDEGEEEFFYKEVKDVQHTQQPKKRAVEDPTSGSPTPSLRASRRSTPTFTPTLLTAPTTPTQAVGNLLAEHHISTPRKRGAPRKNQTVGVMSPAPSKPPSRRASVVSLGETGSRSRSSSMSDSGSEPSSKSSPSKPKTGIIGVQKCRKRYGIERKSEWCAKCRWKKACERYVEGDSSS